jgi:hypothetical protein
VRDIYGIPRTREISEPPSIAPRFIPLATLAEMSSARLGIQHSLRYPNIREEEQRQEE